jgi:hypothetical protein
MNQYYQWPQQQPEMGLAQPGLEQMAQQYAAGGLVAFADGGPVYDVDGGGSYAEGGLASMLPMGYAGEDDVPIYGYSQGEEVKLHQYPRRTLGESVEPTIVDDTAEDEDAFWEDMPNIDKLEAQGVVEEAIPDAAIAGYEKGLDFVKSLPGETAKVNNYLGQKIVGKAKEAGQRWGERLAPYTDKVSELLADRKETQRLEGLPAAYAAAMESGAPMPSVTYEPTISGEDRKQKEAVAEKGAAKAAEVAAMEKPATARKAPVSVPSANPVRLASTPAPQMGTPGLEPIPAEEERKKVAEQAGREVEAEFSQPSTPAQAPEQRAIAQQIVESKLTADQQIAALEKYLQTDTSEAMRIKGEMEKENAHAGNVGIMAVLANALGMGLGTYGTGAARWGAGLMAGAQGMMSEQKAAAARQDEINKLRREIAESPSKRHAEATKLFLEQQAASRKGQQELQNKLIVGKQTGEYGLQKANIGAGASMRNKDVDIANRSAGEMNAYQRKQIEAKAVELGMKDYEQQIIGKQPDENLKNRLIAKYYQQLLNETPMGVTPDLVVGPRTSRGMYDPTRGFTAYQ